MTLHAKEFLTGAEIIAHSVEVRDRINKAPAMSRRRIQQSMEERIRRLEQQVNDLTRLKEILELNISDYQASLIRQGEKITMLECNTYVDLNGREKVSDICAEVLKYYPNITWNDIVSARRHKHFIEPRHRCMVEVYKRRADLSLPALGRIFKRDHTSILNAVRKARRAGE